MTSSQGFPSKHVKINMSSVLIHKYTFQPSFPLEKCAVHAEPKCFFLFVLFSGLGWPRMDWTLSKAEIKYDLTASQFLEIL